MEFSFQRPEPGKWAAAIFSLLMHGLLVGVLFYGVQWQRRAPEPVSVELVAALPPAPRAEAAQVRPPEPQPEPVEVRQPEPKPVVKPDIALKEPEKKKPEKKKEAPKPAVPKQEPKPAAKPVDKRSETRMAEMDRLFDREQQRVAEVSTRQRLDAEAASLRGKLDAADAQASLGQASGEWAHRVGSKVKANIVRPAGASGNPVIEFEVELVPGAGGASIIGEPKLIKGSGNVRLDEAVMRAIVKSDPLPMPARADVFQRRVKFVVKPLEELN